VVARVTAGLAESNGSLLPGLRLTSPGHLQADCQEPGSVPELISTLGNRVRANFFAQELTDSQLNLAHEATGQ